MTNVDEHPIGKAHGGYTIHKPSFAVRFWRRMGFRYHLGEDPKGTDKMEGWMCTETRMQFSFLDRLRLLMSGRLYIRLVQHTPVQCDYSKNRLDWFIEPPGGVDR